MLFRSLSLGERGPGGEAFSPGRGGQAVRLKAPGGEAVRGGCVCNPTDEIMQKLASKLSKWYQDIIKKSFFNIVIRSFSFKMQCFIQTPCHYRRGFERINFASTNFKTST